MLRLTYYFRIFNLINCLASQQPPNQGWSLLAEELAWGPAWASSGHRSFPPAGFALKGWFFCLNYLRIGFDWEFDPDA